IGRTLIPRYFSTVFEGGVTDLYYILKHSKESYHNSSITVDCDQCAMVTQHGKPMFTKTKTFAEMSTVSCSEDIVCTEGRLILEFTFDDLMRIKTWHFTIRQYRELVPRSILAMHAQDPQVLDQLSKNITRMGLTNFTLNYLRGGAHRLMGKAGYSSSSDGRWHIIEFYQLEGLLASQHLVFLINILGFKKDSKVNKKIDKIEDAS
ncbi:hypothetical protein EI555_002175, partial [Monodon monoceros]